MSSSGFLLNLDIDRRTGRRVPALIFCGIVLTLTAVGMSGMAWPLQLPIVAVLLAGGGRELHRAWPGTPRCVTRIQVTSDGRLLLGLAGDPGVAVPVTAVRWWVLPGFAVGLAFVDQDGLQGQAFLFRDRVVTDVWRRLQVHLRHGSIRTQRFT